MNFCERLSQFRKRIEHYRRTLLYLWWCDLGHNNNAVEWHNTKPIHTRAIGDNGKTIYAVGGNNNSNVVHTQLELVIILTGWNEYLVCIQYFRLSDCGTSGVWVYMEYCSSATVEIYRLRLHSHDETSIIWPVYYKNWTSEYFDESLILDHFWWTKIYFVLISLPLY